MAVNNQNPNIQKTFFSPSSYNILPKAQVGAQPQVAAKPQQPNYFGARAAELNRQFNGAKQEQSDAIQRRFASLGQQASGAAIAAQAKLGQDLEAQRQQSLADLTERQQAQAEDTGLKRDVFNLERQSKLGEMDLARRQMDLDAQTTAYNQAMTTLQSPYSSQRMREEIMAILNSLPSGQAQARK